MNAGAALGFVIPGCLVFHQLRPEWIGPALHRLYRVDRTPAFHQKMALRFARLAEPQYVTIADHILLLKGLGRQAHILCDARQIVLSDVDEALRIAATGTTVLAGELHPVSL